MGEENNTKSEKIISQIGETLPNELVPGELVVSPEFTEPKKVKPDIFLPIIAILIMIAFFGQTSYLLHAVVNGSSNIANNSLVTLIVGNVISIAMLVTGYYFGSSKGSSDKSKEMSKK